VTPSFAVEGIGVYAAAPFPNSQGQLSIRACVETRGRWRLAALERRKARPLGRIAAISGLAPRTGGQADRLRLSDSGAEKLRRLREQKASEAVSN
jgi:hypothetical protein